MSMLCFVTLILTATFTLPPSSALSKSPSFESAGLTQYQHQRPTIHTGCGSVIDDLERMADTSSHGMTNRGDHGNWAHELTHYVNSMFRRAASREHGGKWNGFYAGDGWALTLPEPNIKLMDIAKEIPKADRGRAYQTYLINQQKWWNSEPLYILDEATAAASGLRYHTSSRTTDKGREALLSEWICYSSALVRAVQKRDPGYSHLAELEAFVRWHNARCFYLITQHQALVKP